MPSLTLDRRRLLQNTGAASLLALAMAPPATAARARAVLRYGRDFVPFDPANRRGPAEIDVLECLSPRLVRLVPGGGVAIENDAATRCELTSPTEISFVLKPGLEWSDGFGPVTAEDVKVSFERFTQPGANGRPASYAAEWAALDRVEIDGPLAGRIILKRPAADLWLVSLAGGAGIILSAKALAARGEALFRAPITAGPYRFVEWQPDRQLVLRRNPAWTGPAPHFDEIVLRIVPEMATARLALRAGEIDFAVLEPDSREELSRVASLKVEVRPSVNYVWLGINMEKPPFTDLRVRQAIRLAVNKADVLDAAYLGAAEPGRSLIAPGLVGHWADAPAYAQDLGAARRLLAQAGQPRGFRCRLVLLNNSLFRTMAQVLQAQLAEISIEAELVPMESAAFWRAGAGEEGRALDLYLGRFSGHIDPSFMTQWFTTAQVGTWNWNRFRDAEYDRLEAEARGTVETATRAALLVQAQQRMDASASFVWLTHETTVLAHQTWLEPSVTRHAYNEIARFREAA